MPLTPIPTTRRDVVARDLVATLQALYDSEINVTITTAWDAGYDIALCSPMEWPEDGENFSNEWKHVKTASEIADKLHAMAMAEYPDSTYARKQLKICR